MIDRIKLKLDIKLDKAKVDNPKWHEIKTKDILDMSTGEIIDRKYCYIYNTANVKIYYHTSNNSSTLYVDGRLINLSIIKDRINNLDDVYIGALTQIETTTPVILTDAQMCEEATYDANDNLCFPERDQSYIECEQEIQDLDDVINSINILLYELTGERLDIRLFRVNYMEFCVNVNLDRQELVEQYITMFNLISLDKNDSRYTNHVIEQDLPLYSSCYIKSNEQYEVKQRNKDKQEKTYGKDTYAINFYNKLDQLLNEERDFADKKYKELITDFDKEKAKGVLRLEIKAQYRTLKTICEEYGINNTTRYFGDFIDVDMCYSIIKKKYRYFIDRAFQNDLNFYSYKKAKEIIEKSNLTSKRKANLLIYLRKIAPQQAKEYKDKRHVGYSKSRNHNQTLAELGIHQVLIPKDYEVDELTSSIKLLDSKLKKTKKYRKNYEDVVLDAGEEVVNADDDKEIDIKAILDML